ncbi:hypothetical protein ElyMa_003274600 [Elysia marginata]|uniref:Vertnin n=1 Tax=Elysia marginata TaxID=1093978 RepID=A0AAV4J9C6_9GAST|nr:hypothetical protein ElyMa_003274600 [Elysia marginata]
MHRYFDETSGDLKQTEKAKNGGHEREFSSDSDNNNDRNLEQKSFFEITSSTGLHRYRSIGELNSYGKVSHSIAQDFSLNNSKSYEPGEERHSPDRKRSITSEPSTPPMLSGDKNHPQKYPSRVTTPVNSSLTLHRLPNVSNSPGNSNTTTSSIPWQRRDMSRKEEYEFLELNPFCDLAEFSARHPHVHQRTYYRWKRRIKEEFMVLEQCPDMTFAQFSGVVLQAKENVFSLWKSLIARGKGFFAPSDSSKRLESKLSSSSQVVAGPQEQQQRHLAESDFLQKNLSASFLDFSHHFPQASLSMFNTLKQKSLQEFSLFHQNKHMTYKDFSKLVNISEEVFKEWQTSVQSLSYFQGSTPNHFPSPLQSLPPVSSGQAPDSNGLHRNNLQLCVANALKHQLASEQNMLPGLSEVSNLPASYLASLQNLMFPWPGYYGLSPPLAPQHLLPFMLWPGMPGMMGSLAGAPGPAGSLALLSQLQAASSTSSPASLASGPLHSPKATEHKTDVPNTSFSTPDRSVIVKKEEAICNESQKSNNTAVNLACIGRTASSPQPHQQSDREELGDSGFSGPLSRSRKQNLQEYIHYLHRPELAFRDLVTLFPSISSRTFYRWRKEMNAAVLLLGENPDMEFVHFQAVFPDIPEDIFELWQARAKRGETMLQPGTTTLSNIQESLLKPETNTSSQYIHQQKHAIESKCSDFSQGITQAPPSTIPHSPVDKSLLVPHSKSSPALTTASDGRIHSPHFGEENTVQKKCYKEDYLFVQRNPELDFSSFSSQFPNTSVRTFYRWKKELKDAVEFLRCNPSVDYAAYRAMDATVSEEVFNIWRDVVQRNFMFEDNINLEIATKEVEGLTPPTDENYNSALSYLHLNPSINYSQFISLFPRVKEKMFESWKKETNQLIKYIHNNPNVQFSDISSLLPHVSHSSFLKWKDMPARDFHSGFYTTEDKHEANPADTGNSVEYVKSRMTKAFVYLMYNPTISFETYKAKFDFISPSTFDLWLTKIRAVVVDILSHPSMDYKEFNIKDMSPDLFDKLRSLQPQDLALIDERCREAKAQCETRTHGQLPQSNNTQLLQRAFEYLHIHPSISWEDFHVLHPTVPSEIFQAWKASILDQIAYLKEKPDVTYHQFTNLFPNTSQEVFDHLKRDNCSPSLQNHAHHFLGKHQAYMDKDYQQAEQIETVKTRPVDGKLTAEGLIEYESETRLKGDDGNFLHTESSLSKLAKFAHGSGLLSPHCNRVIAKPKDPAEQIEYHTDLRHTQDKQALESDELLRRPPQICPDSYKSSCLSYLSISQNQENKMSDAAGEGSSSSSSSLSALESLTCDTITYHKNQNPRPVTQSSSKISGSEITSPGPGFSSSTASSHWQGLHQQIPSEEMATAREDDEAFSSQRQKKMSRAEYMFVKANPEVDSQEFSRIFPGVSARTFYRWKKEIRAQMQLSS